MNKMTSEFGDFVLFSEEENQALDKRTFEKDVRGKSTTYVTCLVRNKAGTAKARRAHPSTVAVTP